MSTTPTEQIRKICLFSPIQALPCCHHVVLIAEADDYNKVREIVIKEGAGRASTRTTRKNGSPLYTLSYNTLCPTCFHFLKSLCLRACCHQPRRMRVKGWPLDFDMLHIRGGKAWREVATHIRYRHASSTSSGRTITRTWTVPLLFHLVLPLLLLSPEDRYVFPNRFSRHLHYTALVAGRLISNAFYSLLFKYHLTGPINLSALHVQPLPSSPRPSSDLRPLS